MAIFEAEIHLFPRLILLGIWLLVVGAWIKKLINLENIKLNVDGYGYSLYSDYLQSFWKSGPCPSALNMLNMLLAARFLGPSFGLDLAVTAHFPRQILGKSTWSNSQTELLSSNLEGTYLGPRRSGSSNPNPQQPTCPFVKKSCCVFLQKSSSLICSQVWTWKLFGHSSNHKCSNRGDDPVKPAGGFWHLLQPTNRQVLELGTQCSTETGVGLTSMKIF